MLWHFSADELGLLFGSAQGTKTCLLSRVEAKYHQVDMTIDLYQLINSMNFNNLFYIKNQEDIYNMTSNKIVRQSKIKEIITAQEIGSQEELTQILKDNGFDTTQATLSRDLHELGIVRIPSENGFRYVFHQDQMEQSLKPLMAMEIINVFHNESTIVVKTMPGRAQGVAIYFDRWQNSNIIGTVAGDDTILIVPDTHENVQMILEKIRELMG